jgi:putative membrane protein
MAFSPHERQAIMEAVREAEQQTSGEIVIAIAEQSGDYRALSLTLGLAAGTACAVLGWAYGGIQNFPLLFLLQLAVLVCTDFLLQESGLIVRLSPSSIKESAAARNARAQFVQNGLHTTRMRAAILLFISWKERHVELIPDIGISERESPEHWQRLALQISQQIKKSPYDALLFAVEQCGLLLKKHFPAQTNNPNELPDFIYKA